MKNKSGVPAIIYTTSMLCEDKRIWILVANIIICRKVYLSGAALLTLKEKTVSAVLFLVNILQTNWVVENCCKRLEKSKLGNVPIWTQNSSCYCSCDKITILQSLHLWQTPLAKTDRSLFCCFLHLSDFILFSLFCVRT